MENASQQAPNINQTTVGDQRHARYVSAGDPAMETGTEIANRAGNVRLRNPSRSRAQLRT